MGDFSVFFLRWIVNTSGLWLAVRLFGTGDASFSIEIATILVAGLILSIVNMVVRPVVLFLSFPIIILTLGFFVIVVNGLMVYLSLRLAPGISMTFVDAMFAGIIIGLVNYALNGIMVMKDHTKIGDKS